MTPDHVHKDITPQDAVSRKERQPAELQSPSETFTQYGSDPANILYLQRTIGNRATHQLLVQRDSQPHPRNSPQGPRLLASGADAASRVARVMPEAQTIIVPSSLGDVELRPGTIWSGNKMIVYPMGMTIYYMVGDELYESSTTQFIRDEWFNALSTGASRAMGMVYLAQIEMTFLQGILVPWYVLLGVGVIRTALFYHTNKRQVDQALEHAGTCLRLFGELRDRYPTLYSKMKQTLVRELLSNLASGVSAEDVAFFLGRAIRGVAGLTEFSLAAIIATILKVAAIVTATHLPSITAHALAVAARQRAAELQAGLAEAGIQVSEAEARRMMRELLSRQDTQAKLDELGDALNQLAPVLQQLGGVVSPH